MFPSWIQKEEVEMIVCGVDPGTDKSGFVVFDTEKRRVLFSMDLKNEIVRAILRGESDFPLIPDVETWGAFFIEDIESMGLVVGKSTFVTLKWIGKFIEAYEYCTKSFATEISRGDEKIVLCGTKTVINPKTGKRKTIGDSEVRQAVIDRFPPDGYTTRGEPSQIGTKKAPGPLYGVKGHCWQAMAVVITGMETSKQ